ncbi:hypothetical protein HK405_000462 [Cladochytrium tenue]|nr:hypothetical protein HK405_000462 [Cladochytrium tenue]
MADAAIATNVVAGTIVTELTATLTAAAFAATAPTSTGTSSASSSSVTANICQPNTITIVVLALVGVALLVYIASLVLAAIFMYLRDSNMKWDVLGAHLAVWLGGLMLLIGYGIGSYREKTCLNAHISAPYWYYFGVAVILAGYLWILQNAIRGSTSQYLRNIVNGGSFADYIDRVRKGSAYLGFRVECYHEKEKTKEVPIVSSNNGRVKTTYITEKYKERVSKHTAELAFPVAGCRDASGSINAPNGCALVKISCKKEFRFENDQARARFNSERDNFYDQHQDHDEEMDKEVVFNINGFKKHVMLLNNKGAINYLILLNDWVFKIASVLMLGYFYETWLERNCHEVSYTFVKVFQV